MVLLFFDAMEIKSMQFYMTLCVTSLVDGSNLMLNTNNSFKVLKQNKLAMKPHWFDKVLWNLLTLFYPISEDCPNKVSHTVKFKSAVKLS